MSTSQPVVQDAAGRQFACFPAAVLVFIVNAAEEILFLSHPQQGGKWEIVKGGIEAGESIQEAALRETREEVGTSVQVEPMGIVHAATVCHDEMMPCVISLFYLMAYRGGTVQPGDDLAGSQFRWWSLAEIVNGKMTPSAPREIWIAERAIELYRLWKQ